MAERENATFSLKPIPNGSGLHQPDPQQEINLYIVGFSALVSNEDQLFKKKMGPRRVGRGTINMFYYYDHSSDF